MKIKILMEKQNKKLEILEVKKLSKFYLLTIQKCKIDINEELAS